MIHWPSPVFTDTDYLGSVPGEGHTKWKTQNGGSSGPAGLLPLKFKAEIVAACTRRDCSIAQVSYDFDPTETSVREWVRAKQMKTPMSAVGHHQRRRGTGPAAQGEREPQRGRRYLEACAAWKSRQSCALTPGGPDRPARRRSRTSTGPMRAELESPQVGDLGWFHRVGGYAGITRTGAVRVPPQPISRLLRADPFLPKQQIAGCASCELGHQLGRRSGCLPLLRYSGQPKTPARRLSPCWPGTSLA